MRLINIWRHFHTITEHKIMVARHCFKVGMYWQGLTHDLSKYSPSEFWQGVQVLSGISKSEQCGDEKTRAIPQRGFTTKEETSIIMSTGLITVLGPVKGMTGMKMPLKVCQ